MLVFSRLNVYSVDQENLVITVLCTTQHSDKYFYFDPYHSLCYTKSIARTFAQEGRISLSSCDSKDMFMTFLRSMTTHKRIYLTLQSQLIFLVTVTFRGDENSVAGFAVILYIQIGYD